jgi:ADP-ribose diphosphatase
VKWSEPEAPPGWATHDRVTRYADDHLAVVTEGVSSPASEKPRPWTTVRRKRAVVVAAMTRGRHLLLVRQERIPVRETIWEMPAGQVDRDCPDIREIEQTALRELREETGYVLAEKGELIHLGHFFASPGFTDERAFLFLASPVERNEKPEAEDSIIECGEFSVGQIRDMIASNEIRDANTLSTFARLSARGLIALASPVD